MTLYRDTSIRHTGTPIPSREKESQSQAPGALITYQASPEMLERYKHVGKPSKRPISTAAEDLAARRQPQKGETTMAMFTKEAYLEMRRSGLTRAQVARAAGVKPPTLNPYLDRWGLRDMSVELAEMERFDGVPVGEPDSPRTQASADVSTPPASIDPSPQPIDLNAFDWVLPTSAPLSDAVVHINKSSIRLTGWARERLRDATRVRVGIQDGALAVQASAVGWRTRTEDKTRGLYFGGRRLMDKVHAAGLPPGTPCEAEWYDGLQALVVRPSRVAAAAN